jgi:hypothetical protein
MEDPQHFPGNSDAVSASGHQQTDFQGIYSVLERVVREKKTERRRDGRCSITVPRRPALDSNSVASEISRARIKCVERCVAAVTVSREKGNERRGVVKLIVESVGLGLRCM